ncbi:cytidylyltransferase domain-containing protein [Baekduia sp. Peel2402]|uniref:cytidylyltransferase domain-containing protein n=1 Tax=Baekduia sp. Peel2402 TaxID=3458296 RepID=UPI00403EB06A
MGALAVVQARMSSTRLPGKVLADAGGEPLLALLLGRLRHARTLDAIVVATSDRPDDDAIADATAALGVPVARGPLQDVLHRFALAVGDHPGPIVRITADCPLTDPALVDLVVTRFTQTPGARYGSNIDPPRSYPDGLDVEVFTRAALLDADARATTSAEREHVTPFLRADPSGRVAVDSGRALGELHWTVDTAEDLAYVRTLVARLGDRRHVAPWEEILALSAPA